MANISWIKLSTQIFEDEKIRLIEAMPNGDLLVVIWIKLLTLAGRTNASGYVFLNETTPYSLGMLAIVFRSSENFIQLAFDTFEQFGMIEITKENTIYISNWEKHQSVRSLDKIREQDRIRKQNQREREKNKQQANLMGSHVTVTDSHALDIEVKKKKEIKKDKYHDEFDKFWHVYPRKVDRKKAYIAFLKAIKKHTFENIIAGTEKYANQVQNTEKQFVKHPATFLNNESFIDGYEEGGSINEKNQSGETLAQTYGLEF